MNKINWTAVAILSIVALLVLAFAASLLVRPVYGGWGYNGWGMMGPWMTGGMFFMWLIPIGFLVLLVLGVAWLLQNAGRNSPTGASHACPSCGRGVQTHWKNCPYCGAALIK